MKRKSILNKQCITTTSTNTCGVESDPMLYDGVADIISTYDLIIKILEHGIYYYSKKIKGIVYLNKPSLLYKNDTFLVETIDGNLEFGEYGRLWSDNKDKLLKVIKTTEH